MYRAIADFVSQVSEVSWATAVGQYGGQNTLGPESGCCRVWYLKKMVQVAPTCHVGCLDIFSPFPSPIPQLLKHWSLVAPAVISLIWNWMSVAGLLSSLSALLPNRISGSQPHCIPKCCQKCPHAPRQPHSPFDPPRAPPHSQFSQRYHFYWTDQVEPLKEALPQCLLYPVYKLLCAIY